MKNKMNYNYDYRNCGNIQKRQSRMDAIPKITGQYIIDKINAMAKSEKRIKDGKSIWDK